MQRIYHSKLDYQKGALVVISSCLLLLVLTLLVSPTFTITNIAKALEDEGDSVENNGITELADSDSGVSVSFYPAVGSATIVPTTANGASTKIDVCARIGIASSGGYQVYVGSNDSRLVGRSNARYSIAPTQKSVKFSELETNTWGYSYNTVSCTMDPSTDSYNAVSTGQGELIIDDQRTQIQNESISLGLSFATKIGTNIPADVYSNTITLSVVSSPRQLTLMDVDTMQEVDKNVCKASSLHSTKQLEDIRDRVNNQVGTGTKYWVAKLADGNCWMTQNLALNLTKDVPIEASIINEDGSMGTFSYIPQASTITNHDDYISTSIGKSWNEGQYLIIRPSDFAELYSSTKNEGGIAKFESLGIVQDVSASQWSTSPYVNFTSIETTTKSAGSPLDSINHTYDAHYLVGNYYQWTTATAITADESQEIPVDTQAKTSICPANWRLTRSTTTAELFDTYKNQLYTNSPIFATTGGYIGSDAYNGVGRAGFWWQATALGGEDPHASCVSFSINNNNPNYANPRRTAFSLRCLVLTSEE